MSAGERVAERAGERLTGHTDEGGGLQARRVIAVVVVLGLLAALTTLEPHRAAVAEPGAAEPGAAEFVGPQPTVAEPDSAEHDRVRLSATEDAPLRRSDDELGVLDLTADDLEPVTVDDTFFDLQWYLRATGVPRAWRLTRGDPAVTVAVVDTGVDPFHPDLAASFWRDPVDGTNGLDLLNGTRFPFVSSTADWHGTAVAGVLAARADDGYGIAGVAPEVSIQVFKVYGSVDDETAPTLNAGYGTAIEAIEAATARGADVILLTWGGQEPSVQLRNAIAGAGVPVVVAAGNDDVDLSAPDEELRRFPAMLRLPNLITVTASNLDDGVWREGEGVGANLGVRHVDIAAPGELILAPWSGRGHRYHGGTSFAAPQVAGALALATTLAPRADASELVAELTRTARPVPAFTDQVTSGGILDVPAFLTAIQRPVCDDAVGPAGFTDVAEGSTHARSIDCIAAYGLAAGTGDGLFSPDRPVTRGQMATFLARTLARAGALEDPASLTVPTEADQVSFTDTLGTTHAAAIEAVSDLGIAQGYGDGTFRPSAEVTRGQMAAFLVRTVEHLTGETYVSERSWFDDIADTTHERAIGASRELSISLGTAEPRTYAPSVTLTRAQMASLLARGLDALAREGIEVAPPPAPDPADPADTPAG